MNIKHGFLISILAFNYAFISPDMYAMDTTVPPTYISETCYKDVLQLQADEVQHSDCLSRIAKNPVSVLFAHNSNTIIKKYQFILDDVANCLKQHPEVSILIEGFANKIGNENYNKKLAYRRSMAVHDELTKRGLPEYRLCVISQGNEMQLITGDEKEDLVLNRSVKIIPVKKNV